MSACWWWITGVAIAVDLVILFAFLAVERAHARWLPWYRRYLTSLLWVIKIALCLSPSIYAAILRCALAFIASGVLAWNSNTARRNRDNDRDMRKLEAARSERLTEAQQAAFRREVAAL